MYLLPAGNSQQMLVDPLVDTEGVLGIGEQLSIHLRELGTGGAELVLDCKQNLNVKSLQLKLTSQITSVTSQLYF